MLQLASSTSSGSDASGVALLGSTTPRLFTKPLAVGPPGPCGCGCALTEATSDGFAVAEFAEWLGSPLDPWERHAVIHGLELLPDGRPRFRKLLIIVARQQGKTLLCRILTLFWMFVDRWELTLSTSTNLGYAKESWSAVVDIAERTEELAAEIPRGGVRKAAGEECLTIEWRDPAGEVHRCRYKIAASNRKGGRSLSIDRLILDELREHDDWSAWGAAYNAMSARPYGQCIAITNMGDATSVVLNSLRAEALAFIESGEGDERLGLLEWSAPAGSDPEDPAALAMANPNLGTRTALADLLADARRAKRNGGEELSTFKTEILCIAVDSRAPAIDADAWRHNFLAGTLDGVRNRLAAVLDVSPDQQHATLYAAAVLPGGRTRVDAVKDWSGPGCVDKLREELPGLLARVRPKVLGWFPNGPAASVAADLTANRKDWLPNGTTVEEITSGLPAICMGFESLVTARKIAHSDDPLLNAQVRAAQRLQRGDVWVFSRKGDGYCDAVYAASGAVHLARTMPAPVGKPRLVVVAN